MNDPVEQTEAAIERIRATVERLSDFSETPIYDSVVRDRD